MPNKSNRLNLLVGTIWDVLAGTFEFLYGLAGAMLEPFAFLTCILYMTCHDRIEARWRTARKADTKSQDH